MTLALAMPRPRSAARYMLSGELAQNAAWVQTLNLPYDGSSPVITGNDDVSFVFRKSESDTSAALTVSVSGGDITVTDADTLTIAADSLSTLSPGAYYVDLISEDGGLTTLWASGIVSVVNSLAS
jgi:hypothetical protein